MTDADTNVVEQTLRIGWAHFLPLLVMAVDRREETL